MSQYPVVQAHDFTPLHRLEEEEAEDEGVVGSGSKGGINLCFAGAHVICLRCFSIGFFSVFLSVFFVCLLVGFFLVGRGCRAGCVWSMEYPRQEKEGKTPECMDEHRV